MRSFLFHLGFRFQSVPLVSFLTECLSVEYNLLYKWMLQKKQNYNCCRLSSKCDRPWRGEKRSASKFCVCVGACVRAYLNLSQFANEPNQKSFKSIMAWILSQFYLKLQTYRRNFFKVSDGWRKRQKECVGTG